MKPFLELTPIGQVRRLRGLAAEALKTYGLAGSDFRLVRDAGDTLFRVTAPEPDRGRYLLRIHHPTYRTGDAIALELAWLAAMCADAGLPVPEPVATPDGRLLVMASVPGVPGERNCSLLRWLKGRFVTSRARPSHFKAQGRLMGKLHGFAASWQAPPGLSMRHYDWDGLFQGDPGGGITARQVWRLLTGSSGKHFRLVADRLRQVMDVWGTGPDVYGLIHADLGIDANVLFRGGEAAAIDFGDAGYGYWVFDLAISLEHCREDAAFPRFRDALLEGYAQVRPLPEEQLGRLDLFAAAFYVYWSLWATGLIRRHPHYRSELGDRLRRYAGRVEHYVANL